jgi:hypothetical protein
MIGRRQKSVKLTKKKKKTFFTACLDKLGFIEAQAAILCGA